MTEEYRLVMEYGARQYEDVLALLAEHGYRAHFTQTGGMCPAIEVAVNEERYALITDADGPLSWEREDHRGWAVGVYEFEDSSDPVVFETAEESSLEALMSLLPSIG
ncbi:hypothetical protein QT969_10320 [Rhodococcus sp. CSLK01-03]|uniref:Uncharacterized protein n=1 Tax=Rhodococcus indonesiensis TaxID=3055869 RepID=A0ABT7RM16_9NOCA|nr:hypothetical protein [Rhodococcus indonesiensis]MDM7488685.1 hypothetical protein [Rhodococcus indonesiensis]